MSVTSLSFWQQNQNYWYRVSQSSRKLATEAALITGMGNAITSETQGKSAIANQTALSRVNTQLSAALQAAIAGQTGNGSATNSSSNSSSGSKGPSSSKAKTSGSVAIGTGTVPLSVGTPLATLGVINKDSFVISDGTNTSVYTSSGSDTVADLIGAINADAANGQAQVTASLDGKGHLVLAGKYLRDTISISGDNTAAIGFGPKNNSFSPTLPPPRTPAKTPSASASSSKPASSGGTSGSSVSSATGSSNSAAKPLLNSASNLQTDGTAEILMASAGLAGNILNMLA